MHCTAVSSWLVSVSSRKPHSDRQEPKNVAMGSAGSSSVLATHKPTQKHINTRSELASVAPPGGHL